MARTHRFATALLPSVLLAGCVVVPRTTEVYDPECKVVSRQVVLEMQQVAAVTGCRGSVDCTGLLVAAGVVTATTAVVSGSLAIVGNVAYWIEKQGRCQRSAPAPQTPLPPPAVPQGQAA